MDAIKNHDGYPKLREVARLVPSMRPFKLNIVIRFLERSGDILIDGEGYIVWTRESKPDIPTLADVAELSPEFKELLKDDRD